jgi:leucyl aminopeptidase
VRLSDRLLTASPEQLAVPIGAGDGGARAVQLGPNPVVHADLRASIDALIVDARHTGRAGSVESLPRPLAIPRRVLLVGVGAGDEAGWRSAGAAIARAAKDVEAITVAMPSGCGAEAVRGIAEGLWLASYSFSLKQPTAATGEGPTTRTKGGRKPVEAYADPEPDETLRKVTLLVSEITPAYESELADAATVTTATRFARDLTNMPSEQKTPAWFADQMIQVAAGNEHLSVHVREGADLDGFGGILAVGGGSTRGPRLVEMVWAPPGATTHVVLVGKGITFDTGGICIKPRDGMKLMRKDMGGAAAIMAATFGAAQMGLPVRITALAPMAENMASGSAFRPGDIVIHYGGKTSEILNTDAEGRVVLADALAYADAHLAPDYLIDLATLTGANSVALGKRTAALYSDSDALAEALAGAAAAAGERAWRMPLHDDYVREIRSELADVANSSDVGAGSITAALYLREFTGESRPKWAHLDMSAPSWADGPDAELTKGATGWGVRTLLRWLVAL